MLSNFLALLATIALPMNDTELLARARALEPAALRAMHERFYGQVARYIQFKIGDPHTVEDLTGEVFVRALEGLRRGQGWQESPGGWIMGIARHLVTDHYRRQEKLKEVELNERIAASEETGPSQHALRDERNRQLMQAIQQLTEEQRDVILLRFMEGIDISGVAQALNKTQGAIKALQFRAMRTLAELMHSHSFEDTV
jgi:RNA polymerase sigma-70 factor (ECF subfamily)